MTHDADPVPSSQPQTERASVIVLWPHPVCLALVSCQISAGERGEGGGTLSPNSHRAVPSLSLPSDSPLSRNAHFPRYHLLKSITAFASSSPPFLLLSPIHSVSSSSHLPNHVFVFVSSCETRCRPRGIVPPHSKTRVSHSSILPLARQLDRPFLPSHSHPLLGFHSRFGRRRRRRCLIDSRCARGDDVCPAASSVRCSERDPRRDGQQRLERI